MVRGNQFIDDNDRPFQALMPTDAPEIVGPGGTSTAVTSTQLVRIVGSAASYLRFGVDVGASGTTFHLLPANTVEYFKLETGCNISVAGGTVYITTMQ